MIETPIWYADAETGECLGAHYRGAVPAVPYVQCPSEGAANGRWWTGAAWQDEPTAAARLAEERAAMAIDKWQLVAALAILHPGAWSTVEAYRASPDCDAVTGAAIDYAIYLPRLSETIDMLAYLLGLDAAQTDAVFRLAMTIRG